MSRVSIPTLLVAILVVLILLAYMCTHQVAFNEVAVKVRLGKADENSIVRDPGLKLRWPWPVESIETYETRLRILDTPETESKTKDGKQVIIGAYAVWRIADPLLFYTEVRTVAKAEEYMRSRLSQVQGAIVGQRTLADFVNLDAERLDMSYSQLLKDMLDKKVMIEGKQSDVGVRDELMRDFGIAVQKIGIRRISLPKETTQQVFESMRQERNKIAAGYRQQGKSRAEGIKARAEANANSILAFARRRAKEIESAGIRASTRILEMIPEEDREFFEWLRWLDALRATLSQKTTIFLDQKSPFFDPFVHPPVTPEAQD